MSMPQDQFLESALALPQTERAHLALVLLQSLDDPGEEISAEEFGADLRQRVDAYRRGEITSASLDEVRTIVEQRLAEGSAS